VGCRAWYANRRAVWPLETIRAYTEMSDYSVLGGKIDAIYLTPIENGGRCPGSNNAGQPE
jgi:hypothetical protein